MDTTKTQQKHTCKKVTQDEKGSCDKPPCPPLKEQSQDWEPGQGIRDTPLVLGGTVADKRLQGRSAETQIRDGLPIIGMFHVLPLF